MCEHTISFCNFYIEPGFCGVCVHIYFRFWQLVLSKGYFRAGNVLSVIFWRELLRGVASDVRGVLGGVWFTPDYQKDFLHNLLNNKKEW